MDNVSWLKKEIKTWVSAGIITTEQAEQINALYPAERGVRLITALLVLGAILLGAGVILFFAANWQYMAAWFKVGLVITALVSLHLASYFTRSKYPNLSSTLTLLACIMFGAGIWLVAQVFHINTQFPTGLLLWLLGTLAVAYLLREKYALLLSAALLAAWELAEFSLGPPVLAGMGLLLAAVIWLVYKMQSATALAVALASGLVLVTRVTYQSIEPYNGPAYHLDAFFVPFILLLIAPSLVHMSRLPVNQVKHFDRVYRLIGIMVTGGALFFLALFYSHAQLPPGTSVAGAQARPLLWTYYALGSAGGLLLLYRTRRDIKSILRDDGTWLALYVLLLIIMLVPHTGMALTVTVHLFMFLWALSLIVTGYRNQESMYFTLGLVAFNLYTVFEYFNLGWRTMPKSMFFIAGGLILLLGGFFMEYQRRKVMETWRGKRGAEHAEEV